MDELLRQIVGYLRAMWQYRWWGMAAAWIVGIAAAPVVFMIPDRYESSARIYVDTQSMLKPLMSGLAIQPNIDQQVAMLSRTLISRPTVERLIQMADLDITVKTKEQREALIARLTSKLTIQSAGRDIGHGRGRAEQQNGRDRHEHRCDSGTPHGRVSSTVRDLQRFST